MFPKPKPELIPNTYAYESEPMVKATGFREYDARWLFGKEINLMGIQALGMGLKVMTEMGRKNVDTPFDADEICTQILRDIELGVSKMSGSNIREAMTKVARWGIGGRLDRARGVVR